MALVRIKSKREVVYDPVRLLASTVYRDVTDVIISQDGYKSMSHCYVVVDGIKSVIKTESTPFSRAQAVNLFRALGITGENFDEQLFNLIPQATLYITAQAGDFGLAISDWEIA
jgi:hypothetical protein